MLELRPGQNVLQLSAVPLEVFLQPRKSLVAIAEPVVNQSYTLADGLPLLVFRFDLLQDLARLIVPTSDGIKVAQDGELRAGVVRHFNHFFADCDRLRESTLFIISEA